MRPDPDLIAMAAWRCRMIRSALIGAACAAMVLFGWWVAWAFVAYLHHDTPPAATQHVSFIAER